MSFGIGPGRILLVALKKCPCHRHVIDLEEEMWGGYFCFGLST